MNAERRTSKGPSGVNLFKVAGIQISLDFSWFVIFILILWGLSASYFPRQFPDASPQTCWFAGLIATVLFFLSVIVHEISHSLVAIRSGLKIPEITLFIFGGISKLSEEAKSPRDELEIAIVGPLSSFALCLLFFLLQAGAAVLGMVIMAGIFRYLSWINLALGVFNLVPGFPLDGGRVLRAFIWWKTGSLTVATKWASDMGKGVAIAMMILGGIQFLMGFLIGGLWLLFIGVFLRGVAEGGYQELVVRQSLEGVQVRDVMVREVVTVAVDLTIKGLAAEYFLRYGYKGFPVTLWDGGALVGVVSLADIQGVPEEERATRTVREVMTPLGDSLIISPDASLAEALKRMTIEETGRLLVMQGGRMVGMITKTGLSRFIEIKRILDN